MLLNVPSQTTLDSMNMEAMGRGNGVTVVATAGSSNLSLLLDILVSQVIASTVPGFILIGNVMLGKNSIAGTA